VTIGDRTRNTGRKYIQARLKLNVRSLTKYHRGVPAQIPLRGTSP
jgi:hypothetical protein